MIQRGFEDVSDDYKAFVDKFKPKKTTDDCYTPDNIYKAILDWVKRKYNVTGPVFRPFWPGGDYTRENYDGQVVIDNPPFSILAQIVRFYLEHNVKFFLFAPALTSFGSGHRDVTYVFACAEITYKNGAKVNTNFITNLDQSGVLAYTAPDLMRAIAKLDKENRKENKVTHPKIFLSKAVVTAANMNLFCNYGVNFRIMRNDAVFVRHIGEPKYQIFGGGHAA